MKNRIFTLSLAVIIAMSLMLQNCKKDDEPSPLTIVSVTTDSGVDLTSSIMVSDVPLNAGLILTFDKEIDIATVTSTNVLLKTNDVVVPGNIALNGAVITFAPLVSMILGTTYVISITPNLTATDGGPAEEASYTFKTFGRANALPPQAINQYSYFPFSGNMKDEAGTHIPAAADVKDLTYGKDRFGFAGQAGDFNGSTTLVEIPFGNQYMGNNSVTISFWMKASSTKDGHFVMGLAGWKGFFYEISSDWSGIKLATSYVMPGDVVESEDILFSGTGATKDNGGWQGNTFHKEVLPMGGGVGAMYLKDKWVHVVSTYNAATRLSTMYLNGDKVIQTDFNLWPTDNLKRSIMGVKYAGNLTDGGNKLALGFIQASQNRIITESWADPADLYSNHFKGQLDDLRIFKVALTEAEVSLLYKDEKPL